MLHLKNRLLPTFTAGKLGTERRPTVRSVSSHYFHSCIQRENCLLSDSTNEAGGGCCGEALPAPALPYGDVRTPMLAWTFSSPGIPFAS